LRPGELVLINLPDRFSDIPLYDILHERCGLIIERYNSETGLYWTLLVSGCLIPVNELYLSGVCVETG